MLLVCIASGLTIGSETASWCVLPCGGIPLLIPAVLSPFSRLYMTGSPLSPKQFGVFVVLLVQLKSQQHDCSFIF